MFVVFEIKPFGVLLRRAFFQLCVNLVVRRNLGNKLNSYPLNNIW